VTIDGWETPLGGNMIKKISISEDAYQAAIKESKLHPQNPWRLQSIAYDGKKQQLVMGLDKGIEIRLPIIFVDELTQATQKI
jgi:hypothetical protein